MKRDPDLREWKRRGGVGFIPAALACMAALLAWFAIRIEPVASLSPGLTWLAAGGAEGARGVLSAIASSVMVVAGLVVSVGLVALTLASQQFSPRILRRFAADSGNQWVLGTLLATFVYCLLVLRTVRADAGGSFIPHVGVVGGIGLALASLAALLYFLQHLASSLQVGTIVAGLAEETHAALDRLFPEPLPGAGAPVVREADVPDQEGGIVLPSPRDGYLRAIDTEALIRLCAEKDLLLRLERAPGEFAPHQAPLARVWAAGEVNPASLEGLTRCFVLDRERAVEQDPEFGVLQIVDIALKALSPGTNDPSTAVTCIDYLTGILRHMGTRSVPSPYRLDDHGKPRVMVKGTDFERMLSLACEQIRHYGSGDPTVAQAMIRSLSEIAAVITDANRRGALRQQVARFQASAETHLQDGPEQAEFQREIRRLLADTLPPMVSRPRLRRSELRIAPGGASPKSEV